MSRLKDEYQQEIEDYYKNKIEPQEIDVDIPTGKKLEDSKNDEPFYGDNEPAF